MKLPLIAIYTMQPTGVNIIEQVNECNCKINIVIKAHRARDDTRYIPKV
jgi:hypothetical protein